MTRLRLLRKEAGLTQKELADIIGVKRSTIAAYELGAIEPSQKILQLLANHFNVSVDYILENTNIRTEKRQTVDIHDLMMNILDRLDNDVNVYFNGSVLSDNEKQSFKTIISKNIEMLEQIHLIK